MSTVDNELASSGGTYVIFRGRWCPPCGSPGTPPSRGRDRYRQAEPLLEEALGIATRELGAEHVEVALLKNNFAMVKTDLMELQDAEPILRQPAAHPFLHAMVCHPHLPRYFKTTYRKRWKLNFT